MKQAFSIWFGHQDGIAKIVDLSTFTEISNALPPFSQAVENFKDNYRIGFSSDLDEISEKLFALKTNGGNEFCGEVNLNM